MNKTNKKGFTLVELLVVIAILAILATVSVVGYTAFIERASVSNDENVAAQLNQFLTAMKADSTGDFYNQPVTKDNVWKVVDTMLKENGTLTELKPQSLDYGYHYFFDITDQKFIVLKDSVSGVKVSGIKLLVRAEDPKKPGFFTYSVDGADHEIFLIDTTGSDLATAIRGFYTFDGIEAEENKSAWDVFQEAIGNAAQNGEPDYSENLNSTIFVTKDGNRTTETGDKTNAVVHEDVNSIKSEGTDFSKVDSINVPSSVQAIDNKVLNDIKDTAEITTEKTAQELAETLSKDNGGTEKEITVKITDGDTTVTITIKIENNKNSVVDENDNKFDGSFYNPMVSYTMNLVEKTGETAEEIAGSVGYVSYGKNFSFKFNFVGENPDLPCSSDASGITYSFVGNAGNYLDNTDGTFSFKALPMDENAAVELKIKVSFENTPDKEYTIKTVFPMNYQFKLDNKVINDASTHTITFTPAEGGFTGGEGTIAIDWTGDKYSYPDAVNSKGIVVDTAMTVELANDTKLVFNGSTNKIKLAAATSGTFVETMTIKVGNLSATTKTVKFYDTSDELFTAKNENIMYVGNKNPFKASDLFDLKEEDKDFPSGATLMVLQTASNTDWVDYDKKPVSNYIANGRVSITSLDGSAQFNDTLPDNLALTKSCVCIVVDGIRVSPIVTITAKNGYNVRTYEELKNNIGTNNIVVLADKLTMASNDYIDIHSKKLWGNGATFDVTAGTTVNGCLQLYSSELHDMKIIGKVFSSFQFEEDKDLGASAVKVYSGPCHIENCYIANCREPISINDTLYLKDSVVFGGRMSNIDIRGGKGKLIIEGTVTTVQTPYQGVIGMGISCWFDDRAKVVEITEGANLKQYNFLSSTEIESLPNISIKPSNISADLASLDKTITLSIANFSDIFKNHLIKDETKYGNYWFNDTGKVYVSSGIVCIDKYVLITSENISTKAFTKIKSATYTVKKPANSPEATYKITYDNTKLSITNPSGVVSTNGNTTTITQNFTSGSEFTYTFTPIGDVKESDLSKYIKCEETSAWLSVTGESGYGMTDYVMEITGYNTISKVSAGKTALESRGIHSGAVTMDIRGILKDNEKNQGLYHDHLHIADTGAYNPENVDFNKNASGCMWTVTIPTCADTDNDHNCDICGKTIPTATEGE